MKTQIQKLNNLMESFYNEWEKENTAEMFLQLDVPNQRKEKNKKEKPYSKDIKKIESFINEKKNFTSIIEEWSSIDLKMLDILIFSFEIDIVDFLNRLKNSDSSKVIKSFFEER